MRAADVAVLDLAATDSGARQRVVAECRLALDVDGADAIVLGCAGMADLAAEISATLGAPVVDGVTAAVKLVEALTALGLMTAKHGEYARPLAKDYGGLLAPFSPPPPNETRAAPLAARR